MSYGRVVPIFDAAVSTDHQTLGPQHPLTSGLTANSLLIRNYRGERTTRRPVWFMRQAGRSLPEYRRLRAQTTMLQACLTPDLVTEITLQPVHRHRVDAAILYSDIMIPVRLAGVDVDIVPGVGPVIAEPIRHESDLDALPELTTAALAPISQATAQTVAELGRTPLIGFAGAPFTVASYLIEGRPSRTWAKTKKLMTTQPELWQRLASWVARTSARFLHAQVLAGASAVQLFDSWAGALSVDEYRRLVQPHSAAVLESVTQLGVPQVHFGTGTGQLLPHLLAAGADVIGVDTATTLSAARAQLGAQTPLQGNIDPQLLAGDWQRLAGHTRQVIAAGRASCGHVVNLGHGVPKDTDPDVLTRLAALVHEIDDERIDAEGN